MKLRYQMRGLGIGIIITALLMGVATKKGIPLSDAEIKAKALALGMVESDSLKLTDIVEGSPSPAGEPGGSAGEGDLEESEIPESEPSDVAEGSTPEETGGEAQAAQPESERQPDAEAEGGSANGETVTVTIEFGVTSYHVSQMLEELGLVEDAVEFDNYLCENGYSRKISAGVYEITVGADEEEIIDIITKNR